MFAFPILSAGLLSKGGWTRWRATIPDSDRQLVTYRTKMPSWGHADVVVITMQIWIGALHAVSTIATGLQASYVFLFPAIKGLSIDITLLREPLSAVNLMKIINNWLVYIKLIFSSFC